MKTITLTDIPEEAEGEAKEMAAVAVERYYRKAVVASETIKKTFETKVDSFRTKNGLEAKFEETIKEK